MFFQFGKLGASCRQRESVRLSAWELICARRALEDSGSGPDFFNTDIGYESINRKAYALRG